MKTAIAATLILGVLQTGSVHDVMEAANEGKNSLYDRVVAGKGTPQELKKLAELYAALPGLKPQKGDARSWKEKASALAAAAKEAADGKPGALERLKKAANCKACHDVHKSH